MKRIILIQFRKNKTIADQEKKNIEKIINKKINVINVFVDNFNLKDLKNIDRIILGGSSEFSFSRKAELPELNKKIKKVTRFIKAAIKKNIPMLGICLGHQYIAMIMGSKILRDPKQKEVGTFYISLDKDISGEPLFKNIPQKFLAQEGHEDSIKNISKNMVVLATGEKCNIQSFKLKGKNVYGVQFHPEMDAEDSKMRLKLNPHYDSHHIKIKSSPFAKRVIKNFIKI